MGESWNGVIQSDAEIFERFRLAEDPEDRATGELLDTIPLHNKCVLELGCGTGALTALLV